MHARAIVLQLRSAPKAFTLKKLVLWLSVLAALFCGYVYLQDQKRERDMSHYPFYMVHEHYGDYWDVEAHITPSEKEVVRITPLPTMKNAGSFQMDGYIEKHQGHLIVRHSFYDAGDKFRSIYKLEVQSVQYRGAFVPEGQPPPISLW